MPAISRISSLLCTALLCLVTGCLWSGQLAAQTSDYAGQVQEMYVAYYGRPGDPGGVDFWAEQLAAVNGDLNAIIDAFGNSQEYNDRFGSLSNEQLVDNIYQQMFGRSADPGGLAFYVERLDSGALTLASIALDVANGVQGGDDDSAILENKLEVADAFTRRVRDFGATYNEDNIGAAKELLDEIGTSSASVDDAVAAISDVLTDVGGGCLADNLTAGNRWSFAWNTSRETFAQPDTTTSDTDQGQFTVTIGVPESIGGRTAYPLTVEGDAGEFSPRWTHIARGDDGAILGSTNANSFETVYDLIGGSWTGGGFFAEFSESDPVTVSTGTFNGEYNQVPAERAQTTASDGGCDTILGITLCSDSSTSFSETEYYKDCIGPIGYDVDISYSDDGGGFFTSTTIDRTVELIETTFDADDGTVFNPPPWEEVASLSTARSNPAAVVLNGEIFVLGGGTSGGFLSSVEIYDPETDSWRSGPSLPSAGAFSAEVVDGVIYASAYDNIYYYDPFRDFWFSVPVTVGDGDFGASATYTDASFGNIIVGLTGGSSVDQAWDVVAYQPLEDLWLEGSGYFVGEWLRPSVEVIGDTLYAIGGFGQGDGRGAQRFVESYDLANDIWGVTNVASMKVARDGLATEVLDGKIYAFGGNPVSCGFGGSCNIGAAYRSAEVYDPATNSWTEITPMFTARTDAAAVVLDGQIYVIGGSGGGRLSSVERYTPP